MTDKEVSAVWNKVQLTALTVMDLALGYVGAAEAWKGNTEHTTGFAVAALLIAVAGIWSMGKLDSAEKIEEKKVLSAAPVASPVIQT